MAGARRRSSDISAYGGQECSSSVMVERANYTTFSKGGHGFTWTDDGTDVRAEGNPISRSR